MPEKKETAPTILKPYLMLDAWRGIASLAVVMFHWSGLAVLHQPGLAKNFLYTSSAYGSLGVQIFFVVSGYCIANAAAASLRKSDSMVSFTWARARRIYPAYWIALFLAVLFTTAGSFLANRGTIAHNTFTDINLLAMPPAFYFSNLTLTMVPLHQYSLLGVAWTLCYEAAFYAVVAIALWAAQKTSRPSLLFDALHCCTIVVLVLLVLFPQRLSYPFDLWPQFGLGVMVYDLLARPSSRVTKVYGSIIGVLLLLFIMLYNVPVGAMAAESRQPFAVAALFSVLLLALHRIDTRLVQMPVSRGLGWVGLFSYSLYLTHFMTLRGVNQVSGIVHIPPSLHYLLFAAAIAISLAVAFVFYWCFEKPFLRKKPRLDKAQVPSTNSASIAESPRKVLG